MSKTTNDLLHQDTRITADDSCPALGDRAAPYHGGKPKGTRSRQSSTTIDGIVDIFNNGHAVAVFNEVDHCSATSPGTNLPEIAAQ